MGLKIKLDAVVCVRDRAQIHVHILDVNVNAPVFSRLPYREQVLEGTSGGGGRQADPRSQNTKQNTNLSGCSR